MQHPLAHHSGGRLIFSSIRPWPRCLAWTRSLAPWHRPVASVAVRVAGRSPNAFEPFSRALAPVAPGGASEELSSAGRPSILQWWPNLFGETPAAALNRRLEWLSASNKAVAVLKHHPFEPLLSGRSVLDFFLFMYTHCVPNITDHDRFFFINILKSLNERQRTHGDHRQLIPSTISGALL